MNMQIAAVAALFAVLTAIPQTVLGQSQQFNSAIPSSQYAAAPQYEPYNQAYGGYQYPYQFSNGISGQEPAGFQAYDDQGIANVQGQYGYPYNSYDGQYPGVPYAAANGDAYQSGVPYPYQQQQA